MVNALVTLLFGYSYMPMEAQVVVGKKDLSQHSRTYATNSPALQVYSCTARSKEILDLSTDQRYFVSSFQSGT